MHIFGRTPLRSRVAAVVLLAAAVGVLPGCSGHRGTVDLGLKRYTLDLAFKDATKAPGAPSVAQILAAQEPVGGTGPLLSAVAEPVKPSTVALVPLAACAKAPAGSLPDVPVTGGPNMPPKVGIYTQHVKGTFSLDGLITLKGDVPPFSSMEIANVQDVSTSDSTGAVRTVTYDVIERTVLSTTTTRYQSVSREIARNLPTAPSALASELDLVSAETKTATSRETFTPDQPVTIMQYNGEGAVWKSVGVDNASGTTMVVQGTIAKREPIDVCGKLIDTFRVESTEHVTNPLSGYDSQTAANDPNVYNLATQFGGLMVQVHTSTTTTFTANGASETLVLNDLSTLDSITPRTKTS